MSQDAAAPAPAGDGLPSSLVKREDGVYFKAEAPQALLQAAVNEVFLSGAFFKGIDYGVFIRALYGAGPELPEGIRGQPLWRFADDIVPFHPARRSLYKSVRIVNGEAEYYFEPVFFEVDGLPPTPAHLEFGEFVADMWGKGIRFGIDAPVAREAIAAGKVARLIVARRLNATPGRDATIVEVTDTLHRSNAPRLLANGRFDMHTFQNRFPQVKAHVRLLRKEPRVPGVRGFELSGIVLEPPVPRDLELSSVAGQGTVIEHINGEDYLVSAVEGFISVDGKDKRISIGPKIVSREGVSARTTGNLQLSGEYEEFGDVQELRVVEGYGITVHGDVYGNINSKGGQVNLQRNLMGGSAINANGGIKVKGTASAAVIQARNGDVVLHKAQNCVITGNKVVITAAYNCEIMADEVLITVAEGCSVAARKIEVINAGPRKQAEMQMFVLIPETGKYDQKIEECRKRADQFERAAQRSRAEIDAITSEDSLRNYLALASKVRKQELTLTPEQLPLFQKMAVQMGPALKQVARLQLAMKEAKLQQEQMHELEQVVLGQKMAVIGTARCTVRNITGEIVVRKMVFNPDLGPVHNSSAKDVKAKLRAAAAARQPLYHGIAGEFDWSAESMMEAAAAPATVAPPAPAPAEAGDAASPADAGDSVAAADKAVEGGVSGHGA